MELGHDDQWRAGCTRPTQSSRPELQAFVEQNIAAHAYPRNIVFTDQLTSEGSRPRALRQKPRPYLHAIPGPAPGQICTVMSKTNWPSRG
jgi:hypothetical protein